MKVIKKIVTLILSFEMIMVSAFSGVAYAESYSGTLKQSNLVGYKFKSSKYMEIYVANYQTGHTYVDSCSEAGLPMHKFEVGGFLVFCMEHGVLQKDVTLKTATRSKSEFAKAYDNDDYDYAIDNIFHVLYYGPQTGSSLSELKNDLGFKDSKYYGRNGEPTMGAWIAATQMLVWESQQLFRDKNFKKVSNGLSYQTGYRGSSTGSISQSHYSNNLTGTPAMDIYDFMQAQVKAKIQLQKTMESNKITVPKDESKGDYILPYSQVLKGKARYRVTDEDGKSVSGVSITYDESLKTSTLTITDKSALSKKLVLWADESADRRALEYRRNSKYREFFWEYRTQNGHTQGFVSGLEKPASTGLKIAESFKQVLSEAGSCESPEVQYFPEVFIPIEKKDANPGFDNDISTPMGDAGLDATYILERKIGDDSWETIETATLDEFGTEYVFRDKPFSSYAELAPYKTKTKDVTGCADHPMYDSEDPPNIIGYEHESDTKDGAFNWNVTVKYRITEVRPEGRYVDPDDYGGIREYSLSYYAETHDTCTQVCQDLPWTDVEYNFSWKTDVGAGTANSTGNTTSPDEELYFDKETFVNDIMRGDIQIIKSNETENPFKDSAVGSSEISTGSLWTVRLLSGGSEGCDYVHLKSITPEVNAGGTNVYRVSRDSGTVINNSSNPMKVGTNGTLIIKDVPYGTYAVTEVCADNPMYVLEEFTVNVNENSGNVPLSGNFDGYSKAGKNAIGSEASGTGDYYNSRYDVNLRDKVKSNVIKLVKTDSVTQKTVRLKGTKVYIRYKGNPEYSDSQNIERYGESGTIAGNIYNRFLPNAETIDSKSTNYVFELDENGEFVIPYELPYGKYEVLEWSVPQDYYIGKASETVLGEIGGLPANIYYFNVTEQELHKDGNYTARVDYLGNITAGDSGYDKGDYPFSKFYQAVSINNNRVKGVITVKKTDETNPDIGLENVVFGIYAGDDITIPDGSDGPEAYDSETDEKIDFQVTKRSNLSSLSEAVKAFTDKLVNPKSYSGKNNYETGEYEHSSGARLWYLKDRNESSENTKRVIYVTPEQRDTTFRYNYTKDAGDSDITWDVKATLTNQAGGRNITELSIIKSVYLHEGTSTDLVPDVMKGAVGSTVLDPIDNYMPLTDPLDWSTVSRLEVVSNAYGVATDGNLKNYDELEGEPMTGIITEYLVRYTQEAGDENGFEASFDGFSIKAERASDTQIATTVITKNDDGIYHELVRGAGYSQPEVSGRTITIKTEPVSAPVYFMGNDGVRTEMYYKGSVAFTTITIPDEAVSYSYDQIVPVLNFISVDQETGEETSLKLDWYSGLTPENSKSEFGVRNGLPDGVSVISERMEGFCRIEIVTNQNEDSPLEISFNDGYRMRIYTANTLSGNGVGVLDLYNVYKTTEYTQSRLIETITTDINGVASSTSLPLGEYFIRELRAPAGYIKSGEVKVAKLNYVDMYTPIVYSSVEFTNQKLPVQIDIRKAFETSYKSGEYIPSGGAVFGIFEASGMSEPMVEKIEIPENGRALKTFDLEEGLYYVREINTKTGYYLNNKKFYFEVKETDDDLSDEKTFDTGASGVKGRIHLNDSKEAVISLMVESVFPVPNIRVNGKEYSLNQNISTEVSSGSDITGNLKISTYSDYWEVELTVTDGKTSNVVLHDGTTIDLTMDDGSYVCLIDGVEYEYKNEVSYTGYYSDYSYTKEGTGTDVIRFSAPEGCGDTIRLTAYSTYTDIEIEEDASFKKTVTGGQIVNFTDTKGNELMVALDTAFKTSIWSCGSLKGSLSSGTDVFVTVNGEDRSKDAYFNKSVTLKRQGTSQKSLLIKINADDNFMASEIGNDRKDEPHIYTEPEYEVKILSDDPVYEEPAEESKEEPKDTIEEQKLEAEDKPIEIEVPKTGDEESPIIWGMLLVIFVGLGTLSRRKL